MSERLFPSASGLGTMISLDPRRYHPPHKDDSGNTKTERMRPAILSRRQQQLPVECSSDTVIQELPSLTIMRAPTVVIANNTVPYESIAAASPDQGELCTLKGRLASSKLVREGHGELSNSPVSPSRLPSLFRAKPCPGKQTEQPKQEQSAKSINNIVVGMDCVNSAKSSSIWGRLGPSQASGVGKASMARKLSTDSADGSGCLVNGRRVLPAQSPSSAHTQKRVKSGSTSYKRQLHRVLIKLTASKINTKSKRRILLDVLDSDPGALTLRDGPRQESALALLIRCSSSLNLSVEETATVIEAMLAKCPMCSAILDRRDNTPLHLAVLGSFSSPTSGLLNIVKQLVRVYPRALHHRNYQGKTPLDIARERTSTCPDEVAQLLLHETVKQQEEQHG